ncbi:hypothetical protein [Desulfovibrio inopinatus]|uniref:hypothetical protein n=1 Tax=Desulfovibrio inopinatus TaxID=102109 RepID=UPI0003FB9AFE|nr:hypothetical protein [Desulfovibrio inopinatus]
MILRTLSTAVAVLLFTTSTVLLCLLALLLFSPQKAGRLATEICTLAGADVRMESLALLANNPGVVIDGVHIRSANSFALNAHSIHVHLIQSESHSILPDINITLFSPQVRLSPGAPHQTAPAALPIPRFILSAIHSVQFDNAGLDLRTPAAFITAEKCTGQIRTRPGDEMDTNGMSWDVTATGRLHTRSANEIELVLPVSLESLLTVTPETGQFHVLQLSVQSHNAILSTPSGRVPLKLNAKLQPSEDSSGQFELHAVAQAPTMFLKSSPHAQHLIDPIFPLEIHVIANAQPNPNWTVQLTGTTPHQTFMLHGDGVVSPDLHFTADANATIQAPFPQALLELFFPPSLTASSTGQIGVHLHAEYDQSLQTSTTVHFDRMQTVLQHHAQTHNVYGAHSSLTGALHIKMQADSMTLLEGDVTVDGNLESKQDKTNAHHTTSFHIERDEDTGNLTAAGHTQFNISHPYIALTSGELEFSVSKDAQQEWGANLKIRVPNWKIKSESDSIAMPAITLRSHAHLDNANILSLDELRVESPNMLSSYGNVRIPLFDPLSGNGKMHVSLPLRGFPHIVGAALGEEGLRRAQTQGELVGQIELTKQNGRPAALASLTGKDLAISTQDGRLMTAGLGLQMKGRFSQEKLSATLTMPTGEMLFDQYYMNLEHFPLHLDIQYMLNKRSGKTSLVFGQAMRTSSTWSLNAAHNLQHAEVTLEHANIDPLFRLIVRDPFADSTPLLKKTDVGGYLTARGSITPRRNGFVTSGQLTLHNGLLRVQQDETNQVNLRQINLDLPFAYAFGETGPIEKISSPQAGHFNAQLVPPHGGPEKPIDLRVILQPELLTVHPSHGDHFDVSYSGFHGQVGPLYVQHPLSRKFSARSKAVLDVNLDTFSVGDIRLTGMLHADFPEIILTPERLQLHGDVTGTVFGGKLMVNNLFALHPLSQDRVFGADASITGLNLAEVSQATGIGHVTGRLNLDLDNLTIAHEEPVTFILRAESPETATDSRSISLKAVNAISILGTGSAITDAGANIFLGIFKEFSYSRIGFLCALKNDVFTIRGLIQDDSVEYLVKRGLTGINVVNGNPNNTIGFHDMAERVARVVSPPRIEQ